MKVNPKLLLRVVLDAGIFFVMQPVQGSADDVVEGPIISALHFEPLTLLNQLHDVSPCADPVGKSTRCVSRKAEQRDYGRPVLKQALMVSGFLVGLLLLLFNDRPHDRSSAILVVVDPRPRRVLVAFFFLIAVDLHPLGRRRGNSDLIFVFQIPESFGIHKLLQVFLLAILKFRPPHLSMLASFCGTV